MHNLVTFFGIAFPDQQVKMAFSLRLILFDQEVETKKCMWPRHVLHVLNKFLYGLKHFSLHDLEIYPSYAEIGIWTT